MKNKEIDKDYFDVQSGNEQFDQAKVDRLEKFMLNDIHQKQSDAETIRTSSYDEFGSLVNLGLETTWEDENKVYMGDQWETSFAYRSWKQKQKRPNSVTNLVFNAIQNLQSNITASTPSMDVEPVDDEEQEKIKPPEQSQMQGMEMEQQQIPQNMKEFENAQTQPYNHEYSKKDIADKISCMLKFNQKRNKFSTKWKNIVLEFLKHGPAIAMVVWNNDWIGGRGPKKWVGDVEVIHVRKEDFYPDPAIIDLDYRMQECSFINRKFRKKLSYIKNRWDNGKYVNEENNDKDKYHDEGINHDQAWLVEHWHRGKPKFIPESRKKELLEQAERWKKIDEYKSKDYADMANGELEGIHLAYVCNGVFLEYIPYIYDHGQYPFVFKTRYKDVNNQLGFGEIRQIMNPQLMYNKSDELEIDAFSRQGMGQEFYQKGAITPRQLDKITSRSGVGGEMFEVDNVNLITPRQGVVGNPALTNFKNNKQNMIDKVSSVTPTMMGQAEFSNMSGKAVGMLGNRADVKLKACIEILEDFLTETDQLIIELFAQFYEDDRYYTIKGDQGTKAGKFNREMMMFTYTREGKPETFVPEFEVTVRIMDEKPTDRNIIMQEAFALQDRQIYQPKHVLYALEENKLPSKETVMNDMQEIMQQNQDMQAQNMQAQSQKAQMEIMEMQHKMKMEEGKLELEKMKLELEKHKIVIDGQDKQTKNQLALQGQSIQSQANQTNQSESTQQEQPQQEQSYEEFVAMLQENFPEFVDLLSQLPEDAQQNIIQQAMQLSEQELSESIPILMQTIQQLLEQNQGEEVMTSANQETQE